MQKNSAFLWRPFVQRKAKETFCFAKFCQPYNYGNQLLLLCYRKRLRRWTGLMWICFVVTPVQNKVGQFFLFLICFSTYFKNQNIYLRKHAVKAAKSSCLSLRRVEIRLWKIRSLRCCIRYLWRTKRKSTETVTERCFSCQSKSVCRKLAQSCKKWKLAKIRYTPFLHEALQL